MSNDAAQAIRTIDLSVDCTKLAEVPHLEQFAGLWMIEASRLNFLTTALASIDLGSHLQRGSWFDEPKAEDYVEKRDGVAVISVNGVLQKHSMSIGMATSTVLVRRAIRDAVQDASIRSILMSIESPGGTAAGTKELADEIAAAKAHKPVHAHITDLGASAAYWVASQASRLTANEMAVVGSIGTYQVVRDFSAMAAANGIKVHVIKAGDFKGIGTPGTEIAADQLAYLGELIASMNSVFVRGVAAGRGVSDEISQGWADGKVHMASQAAAMGLVDAVESFDSAFESARAAGQSFIPKTARPKGKAMSETTTPAAITPKDIRAACPGCSSDFVVKCLDDGHTLERCRDLHMEALAQQVEQLTGQVASLTAERDEARSELEKASQSGHGVAPLKETSKQKDGGFQSAKQAYWDAVKAEEAKGLNRVRAMQAVVRRDPELQQAMIDEANGK